jgi:hypothetical protein
VHTLRLDERSGIGFGVTLSAGQAVVSMYLQAAARVSA